MKIIVRLMLTKRHRGSPNSRVRRKRKLYHPEKISVSNLIDRVSKHTLSDMDGTIEGIVLPWAVLTLYGDAF